MTEKVSIEMKLIFLGQLSTGKTSLITRYLTNEFEQNQHPNIGPSMRYKQLKIKQKDVKVILWDTAGQERFDSMTRSYYKGSDGVVLVYDVTDLSSFKAIEDYWLGEIKDYIGKVPTVLIGSKIDKQDRRVQTQDGELFAKNNNFYFFETSAKTGDNVEIAINEVVTAVVSGLNTKQPSQGQTISQLKVQTQSRTSKSSGCC